MTGENAALSVVRRVDSKTKDSAELSDVVGEETTRTSLIPCSGLTQTTKDLNKPMRVVLNISPRTPISSNDFKELNRPTVKIHQGF